MPQPSPSGTYRQFYYYLCRPSVLLAIGQWDVRGTDPWKLWRFVTHKLRL